MKLVFQIVAGIVIATTILFLVKFVFGLATLAVVSELFSSGIEESKTSSPPLNITPLTSSKYSFPVPKIYKTPKQPPRSRVTYRDEYVPGKPIEECMGPDKELNDEVLRCTKGYKIRVPVH